jgi:hypothetical protein
MTASVTSLRAETARLAITRVDESTNDHRADVSVTLHWNGSDHTGDATGSPASANRPLLVAAATLRAIAGTGVRDFTAIEASVTRAAGSDVAMVAIDDPLADQPLIGTALIPADNVQLGFARATLDAVNRTISIELL